MSVAPDVTWGCYYGDYYDRAPATHLYVALGHWNLPDDALDGGGYGPSCYFDPPRQGDPHWSDAKYMFPAHRMAGNKDWELIETYVVEPSEGAIEAFVEVVRQKRDNKVRYLKTQVWRYALEVSQ